MRRTIKTLDLDLVAVVFALQIWRHYLYGVTFQLFTNVKNLSTSSHKDLSNKQCRWLKFLADYDIDVAYHPGKVNVVPDDLNRRLVTCGTRLAL